MARKANQKELDRLSREIEKRPGERSGFFARLLGCSRERINRQLVSLNDQNKLYFEDDRGGLYPFDLDDLA